MLFRVVITEDGAEYRDMYADDNKQATGHAKQEEGSVMDNEPRVLENAKSEALAAFAAIAAIIDLSGEPETTEHVRASDALHAAAVRHLSAALEMMRRAKGGGT